MAGTSFLTIAPGVAGAGPVSEETVTRAPTGSDYDHTTISSARSAPAAATGEDGPLTPGKPFGTRYHIIRTRGVGGMGAVYHAWDTELAEAVAIKVIRPEAMAHPGAAAELEKRFKRELLLARQVTHRNVVRIYDLGEIDGIKYITMSYVEGTDLATLLRKEGTLGVQRSLQITRAILEGLLAAHAAGVVHRDLKPGNIMIRHDGQALIMDFGIARSTSGPPEITSQMAAALPLDIRNTATRFTEATMAGSIVGTVQYMAPEQARGEDVDQRADLYALGLIIYDMMAGRARSNAHESPIAGLKARMEAAPPAIQSLVPAVPSALNEVVMRCLHPDRDKRFATTQAFADALARLDDKGAPLPVRRVVGLPLMVAIVAFVVAVAGGLYYYQQQFIPPAKHDPVSVIIADLENKTGDAAFTKTLEPMLQRALEDAAFISAYDRLGIRGLGVARQAELTEASARDLAVKQGLGVVLGGAIETQPRGGYRVSLRATQTVTGAEIASVSDRAAGKDDVLAVATRLVGRIRSALGDESSQSAQQFAMASISATSLDAVRYYAAAMEAAAANRFDDARQNAEKAVLVDPKFGIGYLIASTQALNVGNLADAQKYREEALRHLDGMTERERYHVRGASYLASNDYEQCVKEYQEAIGKYPADVAGRNQLALCLSYLRRMREAADVMREVVKILPGQPLFRDNLSLYLSYGSDFQAGEKEARAVPGTDMYARLALAFAQLGQGQVAAARETYMGIAAIGRRGPSLSAAGLGDIALLEGRFAEGIGILRESAAASLKANDATATSAKLIAAAYGELSRGRNAAAVATADEALAQSSEIKTKLLAARIYVEAGALQKAQPLAVSLAGELYAEPRAYAKQIEGVMALKQGDARMAFTLLRESTQGFDSWLGQFDLGRASLEAGLFAQADSAFDGCVNTRRGEALALFVDEQPTFAYLAPAHYYLGRAREGLQSQGYAESYKQYLALRENSTEDPLLPEVRRRAGR